MKNETVITAVPKHMVKQLTTQKGERIVKVNTIPGINRKALDAIREYYVENVGYDDYPIACLGKLNNKPMNIQSSDIVESGVLPVRANDTMLLEIQLPEDLIVSVDLDVVLRASKDFAQSEDADTDADIAEGLKDSLVIGIPSEGDGGSADMLSFIPFLDLTQCKRFAVLDESFNPQSLESNRWKSRPITEVAAFL